MDDRIPATTGENVAFLLITEKRCRLGSLQIYIHWTKFWTTNPLEWKNLTGGLNLIRLTFPQAGEEKKVETAAARGGNVKEEGLFRNITVLRVAAVATDPNSQLSNSYHHPNVKCRAKVKVGVKENFDSSLK